MTVVHLILEVLTIGHKDMIDSQLLNNYSQVFKFIIQLFYNYSIGELQNNHNYVMFSGRK